jgi:hypothetical protein
MPRPKNVNTSAATVRSVAVRVRGKHEKWAAEMREWGWTVQPPAEEDEPKETRP